jgi:hypothetical protein
MKRSLYHVIPLTLTLLRLKCWKQGSDLAKDAVRLPSRLRQYCSRVWRSMTASSSVTPSGKTLIDRHRHA